MGPSLRSLLPKIVPTWLSNTPAYRRLYSILWATSAQGDVLRQQALEGQLAAYPGVGTPTALPYIGASRLLLQGPSESNATFATRCIQWLKAAASIGSPAGLCLAVQAYLVGEGSLGGGVYPVVAFIDRAGNLTVANADQTTTRSKISWNWDGVDGWVNGDGYHPPFTMTSWGSDGWLIVQDPYTHYTGFTDSNWLLAWNAGTATVDSLCSQRVVQGIQSIVTIYKGAHIYVRQICWVPDVAAFLSSSAPDGTYGNYSHCTAGAQRNTRTASYSWWERSNGG